jgi:hypothetical protein
MLLCLGVEERYIFKTNHFSNLARLLELLEIEKLKFSTISLVISERAMPSVYDEHQSNLVQA